MNAVVVVLVIVVLLWLLQHIVSIAVVLLFALAICVFYLWVNWTNENGQHVLPAGQELQPVIQQVEQSPPIANVPQVMTAAEPSAPQESPSAVSSPPPTKEKKSKKPKSKRSKRKKVGKSKKSRKKRKLASTKGDTDETDESDESDESANGSPRRKRRSQRSLKERANRTPNRQPETRARRSRRKRRARRAKSRRRPTRRKGRRRKEVARRKPGSPRRRRTKKSDGMRDSRCDKMVLILLTMFSVADSCLMLLIRFSCVGCEKEGRKCFGDSKYLHLARPKFELMHDSRVKTEQLFQELKGLVCEGQGLTRAEEPWSGFYEVKNPIWISAHTTLFTEIGWRYLKHGYGVGKLRRGGSYVALTSPDTTELTIIIETMTYNHSKWIYSNPSSFTARRQKAVFSLTGSFAKMKKMHIWKTRLDFNNRSDEVFKYDGPIEVSQGLVFFDIDPDTVITLTTRANGKKGSHGLPPPSAPFPLPYMDDFDNYTLNQEPSLLSPQTGVWEIRQDQTGKFARQVVIGQPVPWIALNPFPLAIIGDATWEDITLSTKIRFPSVNGTNRAFLGLQVRHPRGYADFDDMLIEKS